MIKIYKKIIVILMVISSLSLFTACEDKKQETKEATSTTSTESKVKLTDTAIKITTNTLKQDTLVKDVAIVMESDNKTVNLAIKVNATTNKDNAKDLICIAVKQLGANCGGEFPTKTLGEVWDNCDGHVTIFSGEKDIILDGYLTKGSNNIEYK